MREYELLELTRASGAFDADETAGETIRATLHALGDCITSGERREVAEPLPEHYASSLREGGAKSSPPDPERERAETQLPEPYAGVLDLDG